MARTATKNHKTKTHISKTDVRQVVIEVVREIFDDPDYGLPLTPYIVRRLKKSMKSKKEGRLVSFDEILKREKIKNK